LSARRIAEDFRKLSLDEKLALLHSLWDEVAAEAEARPLSDDERRFLDERIRALESDVRPDRDWASVRDELLRGS
jgi:putative addiction module component (TIGR02574 family)